MPSFKEADPNAKDRLLKPGSAGNKKEIAQKPSLNNLNPLDILEEKPFGGGWIFTSYEKPSDLDIEGDGLIRTTAVDFGNGAIVEITSRTDNQMRNPRLLFVKTHAGYTSTLRAELVSGNNGVPNYVLRNALGEEAGMAAGLEIDRVLAEQILGGKKVEPVFVGRVDQSVINWVIQRCGKAHPA